MGLALALVTTVGLAAETPPPEVSDETVACLVCHSNRDFTWRMPSGETRRLFVAPDRFYASVHGQLPCGECHGELGSGPHTATPTVDLPSDLTGLLNGRQGARAAATAACVRCHEQAAREYAESVHGQASRRGVLDVPLCGDCHSAHYINPADDLESTVNPGNVPATCAKCHADALVMARHDVKTNVVETFETSFHGRKRLVGDKNAAVCTSCHGVHAIYAPRDPRSTVNPANAVQTCGECHKNASPQFAASFKHTVPSHAVDPLIYNVKHYHHLVLVTVLTVMFLHIFMDIIRRQINRRRGSQ